FFFFQAEDGIRCLTVTGVQTCALPIYHRDRARRRRRTGGRRAAFALYGTTGTTREARGPGHHRRGGGPRWRRADRRQRARPAGPAPKSVVEGKGGEQGGGQTGRRHAPA